MALDRNEQLRRQLRAFRSQKDTRLKTSALQFVTAQHAYLNNVQTKLPDYLLRLELHKQSQMEVAALAAEVTRWVLSSRCAAC